MAYQAQQFQILTPDQANAFWPSFNKGAQIGTGLVKLPQELQQLKLQNAIDEYKRQQSQAESKYYPEMALANLQQAQALPEETRARTGLYGAQTNEINTLTPEKLIELQLKNKFYPKEIQSEIDNNKALADWRKSGGSLGTNSGGVSGQSLALLKKQTAMENPNFTPEQVDDAASAYIEGRDTLKDGTKLNTPSGITASLLDIIAKQRSTTAALNQNRYSATLDTLLDTADKLMPSMVKYSGLAGKAKGSLEGIAQSLGGQGSPDYQNYYNFTRTIVPSMAGEFLRVLGASSTDTQKQMMIKMADPTNYDANPETALNNFNFLYDLYKNKISSTIKRSTHELMLPPKSISNNLKNGTSSNPIKLVLKNGKLVEE